MQRRRSPIPFVSLVVLIIVIALPSCSSTIPSGSGDGLLILSHSTYVDRYGYFHLVGEVQNVGEHKTTENTVSVAFYDEEGVSSATGLGPCYKEVIAPKEKSPFEIIFPDTPQDVGYKLTAEWQVTEMQSRGQMVFEEVRSTVNTEGQYVVTGRVLNRGSQAVEYVMVLCTFYDGSGKVVAVGFTFADDSPIGAGNSSAFALLTDPSVSSKIYEFVLQWQT